MGMFRQCTDSWIEEYQHVVQILWIGLFAIDGQRAVPCLVLGYGANLFRQVRHKFEAIQFELAHPPVVFVDLDMVPAAPGLIRLEEN